MRQIMKKKTKKSSFLPNPSPRAGLRGIAYRKLVESLEEKCKKVLSVLTNRQAGEVS